MLNPDQLIGRRLRKAIVQGEPFMTTDLYLEGAQEFQLRPGYAAVSIQVPLERGGFVARGTVVDVLFRARPRRAEDDRPAIPEVTVTLMEGVEVLSAERPLSSVSGQPRARNVTLGGTSANVVPPTTVVLEIAPEDANKLWAVEGHGDISLVSRNLSQMPVRRTAKRMTLEEVLGIESASAAPSPFVTEIYRGGQRSTQVFPPRPSS
jgi:Flp pilus assembly protein CpaB